MTVALAKGRMLTAGVDQMNAEEKELKVLEIVYWKTTSVNKMQGFVWLWCTSCRVSAINSRLIAEV